jgi:uncharacterized membrane protein
MILAALMLLVGAVSFWRLGEGQFVLDEEVSLAHAQESWAGVWHVATRSDPNMSLYYACLKIWTGIFGDSVPAVRSLSVVAAVSCIPGVYALGARLFGVSGGLIAGLLISTNVFFLEYAQLARSYTLVTLLVTLSSYFFVSEFQRPGASNRVGYVVSSVVAFHAHAFAIWVLLVQALILVAFKRRAALTRTWFATFALTAALIAPMAYAMKRTGGSGLYWIEEPTLGAIPATYAQLAGNSFLQLAIVVAACVLALRRAASSKALAFGLAFTASWAFLPTLATFAVSEVLQPVLVAKYLIVSLPAFAVLAAGAIVSVRPIAGILFTCSLVALSLLEVREYYDWAA